MEYQLLALIIAGIFFGVGICITGILIHSIIQSRKFDLNLEKKKNDEEKKTMQWDITSIRKDIDSIFTDIHMMDSRIEELEKKSNTKKKAQ
jgi:hypothetical protein